MMNSHRLVRVSSLEGLLREKVLPMEQDADPPSASSLVSTSPDDREEIKDGFVEVKKSSTTSSSSSSAKSTVTQKALSNSFKSGGYAAKVAAAAAAAVLPAANHQRRSSRTSTQGTVTAEYGFRYTNPTQDTLVYIILYKTEKCNRKPCARTCEKYHSVKERRRSPLQYDYSEQPCPNVKAGASSRAWGDPSKCPEGDECQFSHTLLEQMYHPNIYKTGMCNKFSADPATNNCSWSALCTHAHGPQDRDRQVRAVAKLRDLIDSGVTEWTVDNLTSSPERQSPVAARVSEPAASVAAPPRQVASPPPAAAAQDMMLMSKGSVDLQVRVEDEEDKHPGISSSDPILRTPVDASPSYDATLNRSTQGAPFLSSFSNVPQHKAGLDRPSSVDRIPIGPLRKTPSMGVSSLTSKMEQVSSSPLTQAMNLGSLPMAVQKPTKLERALSGPSSFAVRNASSFGTPHGSSMLGFSMLNPLMGAASDSGIWGGFSPSVEAEAGRFGNPAAAVAVASFDELKKEVDRLKERTTCPECRSDDRAVVVIPCKHFLCQKCAEESSRHRSCLKCNAECQAILTVAL